MATVTYKVPVAFQDKRRKGKIGYEERTGTVAIFKVAGRQVRCAIQENGALAHIASGNLIVNANMVAGLHVRHAVSRGTYTKLTARDACKICLDEIIAKIGAEKFFSIIDAAPVIN